MTFSSRLVSGFAAVFLAIMPIASAAQDTADEDSFALELNAAANTTAGSCRLTYVATNQSDNELSRTAFEVAVFDGQGVVNRLLVLEFGELIAGKTKILQFDLGETPCEDISRIVVNASAACTQASDGEESDFCMSGLNASSRTAILFGI